MPDDKDFELDDLDTFSFDDVPMEGTESELKGSDSGDEFGVWVKSAPEDVTEGLPDLDDLPSLDSSSALDSAPELEDLPDMADLPDMDSLPSMETLPDMDSLPEMDSLPDMDNLPSMEEATSLDDLPEMDLDDDAAPAAPAADSLPEEDFLSSEELASLDDQFDFVTVSEEPLDGEASPDEDLELPPVQASQAPSTPGDFDEISLDDFVTFDDNDLEDVPGPPSSPTVGDQAPVNSDDDFNEEFLDIDIDINDDVDDEELEILEGAQVVRETPKASGESFVSEEVDMSEFGDFAEVTEFDEQPAVAPTTPVVEEFSLDSEPEFDPNTDLVSAAAELDVEHVEDFAVDLDAGDLTLDAVGEFEETILDESLNPDDETDLDHIMALEENLTSGIRATDTPEASTPPAAPANTDVAALILSKIEQELSSIKKEISDLKKDFTVYRDQAPILSRSTEGDVLTGETEAVPEDAPVEKAHKGFFDEEEDETIALTGDELDNILSSAEISEEDDSGEALDEDLIVTDAEGNLPSMDEPAAEEAPVHVTDEEFFSGTSLEDDEPSIFDAAPSSGGVPESIELEEEEFPLGLEEDMTVDLLSGDSADIEPELASEPESSDEPDFMVEPDLAVSAEPEIVEASFDEEELEAPAPERLEIPFDDELVEEPEPEVMAEPVIQEPVAKETDEDAFSMPVATYEAEAPAPSVTPPPVPSMGISESLKDELKAVLAYMDKLLVSLPDEKIQEFAESEHFEVYKKLFEELGLKE